MPVPFFIFGSTPDGWKVNPWNPAFLAMVYVMDSSGVSFGFSLVNIASMFLVSCADETYGLYTAGTFLSRRSDQLMSLKKGWLMMSDASFDDEPSRLA